MPDDLIRDGSQFADAVKAVTGEYPIITAATMSPADPYAAYMSHIEGCPICWHGHPGCEEGQQLISAALGDSR